MISTAIERLWQILSRIQQAFQSPYFGFVQGHAHLSADDLQRIGRLVGIKQDSVVAHFERQFARLIGSGDATAYAAARMGFYELMRLQGIGKGDEVILPGATCSVMVNAVMRAGATPVFADIDPDTFGSSSEAIAVCITPRTRMIVAQHSFGIPCAIKPIVNLARSRKIFLLEDCALTLGSKVNGITVGNFGDAALFSTDHSKPLNTLTGGLIYTQDSALAHRLKHAQSNLPDLSIDRQNALWNRLLLEARYCIPEKYGRMGLVDLFSAMRRKFTRAEGDLLTDDFGVAATAAYPYPARLPAFLAAIGQIEVLRWAEVSMERANTLKYLLDTLAESRAGATLPCAYKNEALEIVPLRLAWSAPDGAKIRRAIRHYVHVPWTWFMTPIIATREPLENLGYHQGTCPISERIGPDMINVPCNLDRKQADVLISLIHQKKGK